MNIRKKYRYEIEWEENDNFYNADFCREVTSEFDAVTYAIDWIKTKGIDTSKLMYCRVEEVFNSEMRSNVLLWIGE